MINVRALRFVLPALMMSVALASCSQGEEEDVGLVQAQAYLEVAELYRSQGQFRASVIEAQNALQQAPNLLEAILFVSQLYLDLGDLNQALAQLNYLYDQEPENTEVRLLLAETSLMTGNFQQALSLTEDMNALSPEEAQKRNWIIGNAQAANNNEEAAEASLQEVLASNPGHIDALISLSKLAYQNEDVELARSYMDRAIQAEPENLDLFIWTGQFELLQQNYLESEQAFFEALQIMGAYDTMTGKRFNVLQSILIPLQMQQKNEEALRYSQIIADTPQGEFQNTYANAVSLFQEGNYEQAEQLIGEMLSTSPNNANSNILLGMTQYAQGDYQAARESLDGLVNADSSSAIAVRTLAGTYLRLNQPERAVGLVTDARETYPDDPSLTALLAFSEQSLGNLDTAYELYQEALGLAPDSANIHFSLASNHYLRGDLTAAIESLETSLELDPNYEDAKRFLVQIYVTQNEFELARSTVQQWLDIGGGTAIDSNLAGRVAFAEQNVREARQFFESTLRIDSDNVEARLFLAGISQFEESYDEARAEYRNVLQVEPNNIEAMSGLLAIGDLTDSENDAIAEMERIIEANQSQFESPMVLARYFLSQQQLESAQRYGELALERNQNSFTESTLQEILLQQVLQARQSSDLDLATSLTEQALAIQGNNLQVLISAAAVAAQDNNNSLAEEYISRIKELAPESSVGFELEGDLREVQGDFDAAIAAYTEGWELLATTNIGVKLHRTFLRSDRQNDADEFLQDWLAEFPEDSAANLLYAMNLQSGGQDAEAIERYESAMVDQPDNIIALNNLAWLYQDSNPERARELATRAVELYPDNADILDTFGWIMFKQDELDLARTALERAAELAPDSASIAEHLEAVNQ